MQSGLFLAASPPALEVLYISTSGPLQCILPANLLESAVKVASREPKSEPSISREASTLLLSYTASKRDVKLRGSDCNSSTRYSMSFKENRFSHLAAEMAFRCLPSRQVVVLPRLATRSADSRRHASEQLKKHHAKAVDLTELRAYDMSLVLYLGDVYGLGSWTFPFWGRKKQPDHLKSRNTLIAPNPRPCEANPASAPSVMRPVPQGHTRGFGAPCEADSLSMQWEVRS